MNTCQKLKSRRKELGLTMLEIANKIGVSEATVSRWESGDIANMRRDKIVSLANALQVSPSFIMGTDEETDKKITAPHDYRQTVYSYAGTLSVENVIIDISKAEKLNKLLKSAQSLSDEQINLLTSVAENMKKD